MKSEISNPKFLIIGYGNPLRGDDGVGWAAIERLEKLDSGLADAELLEMAPRDLQLFYPWHVTTEQAVVLAQRADRIVRMADGKVVPKAGEAAA